MILSALFGVTTTNLIVLFAVVYFCAFGVPGGVIWLVASGASASTSYELALVMIVGVSAAILGDFSAFMIARRFSFGLQNWLRRFSFYRKNEAQVKSKFNKSEFFLIFFSRFILQSLCAATTYVSGFLRLKKRKFLVADISGEFIYGVSFPLLGFFFRETWKDYTTLLGDISVIILLAVVAFFLLRWAVRYYKIIKRRTKK